jgi:hypothetical protein
MKSRNVVLAIAVTVVTAMTIPTGLAAQDDAAQAKKAQHHHYKLIVLGTLGGPQSYGDAGHGAANITNKGVAAGDADTNIPDPFYPNYNPLLTGGLIGSYPYRIPRIHQQRQRPDGPRKPAGREQQHSHLYDR